MAPGQAANIGPPEDAWTYSPETGFDLTRGHPNDTTSPHLTLATSTAPITLSVRSSALIIIDMQNYFLSPALGCSRDSAGHRALHHLVTHALPAARKSGLRVVWVNWGLTQAEIDGMPAGISRAFGFVLADGTKVKKNGQPADGPRGAGGPGSDCGKVVDPETGEHVEAGRILMRGEWNTGLYPPLDRWFEEGERLAVRPDLWVHKNRMSGMWGLRSALEGVLESQGIRTLLFTGVNTDQCVSGTLTDAFSKGYDCVLLSDGCGTTSPQFSQQCIEFNAERTYGFLSSCEALKYAVDQIPP